MNRKNTIRIAMMASRRNSRNRRSNSIGQSSAAPPLARVADRPVWQSLFRPKLPALRPAAVTIVSVTPIPPGLDGNAAGADLHADLRQRFGRRNDEQKRCNDEHHASRQHFPTSEGEAMRKMKRYVVHPGKIQSKTDGDTHWIGFRQLIELYNVDRAECINAEATRKHNWPTDAIHLRPNYDGDYRLPEIKLSSS